VFLGLAIVGTAVFKSVSIVRAWRVIVVAIAVEIVAAFAMDYQVHNGGYQPGSFVGMFCVAGYWLLTIAFLVYMKES